MKKRITISLILLCLFILTSCNSYKDINNYPFLDKKNIASNEETTNSEETDTLDYIIYNSNGKSAYEVKANKVEDEDDTYPVYSVVPYDITDEEIKYYCDRIFDKGSKNVILPLFLTRSDYIEKRRYDLTKRKDELEDKGEEIPLYIDVELQDLQLRSESENLDANYTISYENEIKWIDLHNFYMTEMDSDTECRVCYVEGTIDGVVYRADFMDYLNNQVVSIYRPNAYANQPDAYTILKDAEHLPFDKNECNITEQEATKKSEEYLSNLGIEGYSPIAVYPVCLYGEQVKPTGNYLKDVKSGYACFFAREVNGKTRPFNSYVDDSIFISPYANYLMSLPSYEDYGVYSPLEIGVKSGVYRLGYEYLRICITDDGIEQCIWNSPSDMGDTKTPKAQLLSFDKIDDRARQFLQYYADKPEDLMYFTTPKIDLVQLGMCRVTEDDVHYYMVPAWYYYVSSDVLQLEKNNIVCINAIDGSIIDVRAGGNTIEISD